MEEDSNNISDLINAVASLWKLGLELVFIITIIVFRTEIKKLAERIWNLRFKKGDTELSIEQVKPDKIQEPQTEQSQSENIEQQEPSFIAVPTNKEPIELFNDMIDAFQKKDFVIADKSFDELQKMETNDTDKRINEVIYLTLAYINNYDSRAVYKIEELTKFEDVRDLAYNRLTYCYEFSNNNEKALEIHIRALSDVISENAKTTHIVKITDLYNKLGREDDSLILLKKRLEEIRTDGEKADIFSAIANTYKKLNNKTLSAIALQKVIQYKSEDLTTLFDAAYSQGEAKFLKLSIMNYHTLLGFDPKYQSALNNLGVKCFELDMQIKSVDYFKMAVKEKNTLSMSNLAYRYMNSGFKEEAQGILDEAIKENNRHRNVGSALADLSDKQAEENRKWDSVNTDAVKEQQFFWEYADAYFYHYEINDRCNGDWLLLKNKFFKVTREGDKIIGIWEKEDDGIKFEGNLTNRSAEIKYHIKSKQIYSSAPSWGQAKVGYLYFSEELDNIHIFIPSDSDEYIILTRNDMKSLVSPKN